MGRLTRVLQHLGVVREPMDDDGRLPWVERDGGGRPRPITSPHSVAVYDRDADIAAAWLGGAQMPADVAEAHAVRLAVGDDDLIVMLVEHNDPTS